MEFYQHGGSALATLNWAPIRGSEIWHGEYFDNAGLQGAAAFSRDDVNINFNWGNTPPGGSISQGVNWSARWTARRNTPSAGYYTVSTTSDDGVRVWIDNTPVIDEWHDSSSTTYTAMPYLGAGQHDWRVEFYQHAGTASLSVDIQPGAIIPATNSAPRDLVVDTESSNFLKNGGDWQSAPNDSGGVALWTKNNVFVQTDGAWVRWYALVPRAGYYQVSVYLPGSVGTTRRARYEIAHAGAYDFIALNQSLYSKQWVPLGVLYFAASGGEYVSLSDVTYEPAQSTVVVADAVRFAAR
jgi:hypothetical protein